ncbi:hypothetical protein EDD66_1066 [Mobilisporobacter senegalensis]|uniref:Uncharacterized protein n=1 Tax=Mobilisporobacter senegalensis TaxID=1329262 RepID=A0A3N1XQE6_9FIRM|nr:hypothetical protein EDD66_1066 [Mobilisporobacter senegalensis]
MKTKSAYIVSVFLLLIIVISILYYIFYHSDSNTAFDGTLVKNMQNVYKRLDSCYL